MKSICSLRYKPKMPQFKFRLILSLIFIVFYHMSCSNEVTNLNNENLVSDNKFADIISVSVKGESNNYEFSVGIESPDTGCDQYADWWEVLSEDSALIYRRILAHSHVNEQPFVRSGGPVPIEANDVLYIRGHMHPGGYGGNVFKGSVRDGFEKVTISSDFAPGVENEDPQPDGCAF